MSRKIDGTQNFEFCYILTSLFYIMVIATSAGMSNSLCNFYEQQGLL